MSEIPIRELMRQQSVGLPAEPGSNRTGGGGEGFGELLKDMVEDVNELQGKAADSVQALTRGEVKDLHQVMIQMSKAELGFKFMMEVRNKLVEAYQEVSRMSV